MKRKYLDVGSVCLCACVFVGVDVCVAVCLCVVTSLECEVIGELCVYMWRLWNAVVNLCVCVCVCVRHRKKKRERQAQARFHNSPDTKTHSQFRQNETVEYPEEQNTKKV